MRCWRNAMAAVLVAGAAGGFVSIARADLPTSIRESATADQSRDAIEKYVIALIQKVAAADKGSGPARDELARQCDSIGNSTASSSFQTVYVAAVANNLKTLLDNPATAIRLEGGIIAYRLAVATRSPQLTPVAQRMMKDPTPAIALYGVKSAGPLIWGLLNSGTAKNPLIPAIIDTVKANSDVGAIVQDAYKAVNSGEQKLPPAALQSCIDGMNGILGVRLGVWEKGVPHTPAADREPAIFFVRGPVIQAMTKPQRLQTVQQSLTILALAAQAGEKTPEAYKVAEAFAGSLGSLLDATPNVKAHFDGLLRLPGTMQPSAISQRIDAAVKAVRGLPEFADIKNLPATSAAVH